MCELYTTPEMLTCCIYLLVELEWSRKCLQDGQQRIFNLFTQILHWLEDTSGVGSNLQVHQPKFFGCASPCSLVPPHEGAQQLFVTNWETILKCPLVSALQSAHLLVKTGEGQ